MSIWMGFYKAHRWLLNARDPAPIPAVDCISVKADFDKGSKDAASTETILV